MAAPKKVDHGVLYDAMTLSQRDFKRQIQVPNLTRQLIIDLAVEGAKATQEDLEVSGTYVYQCFAELTGNPVVNATSMQLNSIRGMLSIPNVITGKNDKLEFIVDGVVLHFDLPQGFYDLTTFANAIAGGIATTSGIACTAGAISAAQGSFTLTMAVGHTLQFNTNGSMARHPRFVTFPIGPAAQVQTVTNCWLFYTRSVSVVIPELTKMIVTPCLGNIARFTQAMTVIYLDNPTAPSFFHVGYEPGQVILPIQYDERISSLSITLLDEYGAPLSSYCSSVGDWFTLIFTITR